MKYFSIGLKQENKYTKETFIPGEKMCKALSLVNWNQRQKWETTTGNQLHQIALPLPVSVIVILSLSVTHSEVTGRSHTDCYKSALTKNRTSFPAVSVLIPTFLIYWWLLVTGGFISSVKFW